MDPKTSSKIAPLSTASSVNSAGDTADANAIRSQQDEPETVPHTIDAAPLSTRCALWGWLVLCFSTGPTSSMVFNYVGACIQSTANAVGHVPGSDKACATRGTISCLVRFGSRDIDYLSYLLYLRAIGRALEGIVSIIVAGAADYAHYRKPMLMGAIYIFGALALPFAGLAHQSYSNLTTISGLYCALTTLQGVYQVIEGSYVPIFMRSVGLSRPSPQDIVQSSAQSPRAYIKGSRVSVLGLISGNAGGLVALLIGVILVYTKGSYRTAGYQSYFLAITIAGAITIVIAIVGHILLPNVPGKPRPKNQNVFLLPARNWLTLVSAVPRYPQAFKLCLGWILWNTGSGNFNGLLSPLFLETAGLTSGSSVYTVYSFTAVIFACIGSLSWMLAFSRTMTSAKASGQMGNAVKYWAYGFFGVQILCVLWGTLGISSRVPIGYKYVPEFWIAQFLFNSTSSALRAYNRMLYSYFIPVGSEALFFGLEITLDLLIGWINPLVQGVIQDKTHNLRYPMLPNLLVILVALCLYLWVDVTRGVEDAQTPLVGEEGGEVS